MNFLKLFSIAGFLVLSQSVLQADQCRGLDSEIRTDKLTSHHDSHLKHHNGSHFGNAGFASFDPSNWYPVVTNSYPVITSLSQDRNKGLTEGNIELSSSGIIVKEEGNYWVTISAILQNPGMDVIVVPAFLAQNDTFNMANPEIGGVLALEPSKINSLHASGIIKNVEPGTVLSIVAANVGNSLPQAVVVVSWDISLFKLP